MTWTNFLRGYPGWNSSTERSFPQTRFHSHVVRHLANALEEAAPKNVDIL